mmetsp:Transcript_100945/g.260896  ORF Transcript_100945/g.260896 Transcript_100945/m.260896 type:complete len:375 (-) Transcript_100945:66-1190(-)
MAMAPGIWSSCTRSANSGSWIWPSWSASYRSNSSSATCPCRAERLNIFATSCRSCAEMKPVLDASKMVKVSYSICSSPWPASALIWDMSWLKMPCTLSIVPLKVSMVDRIRSPKLISHWPIWSSAGLIMSKKRCSSGMMCARMFCTACCICSTRGCRICAGDGSSPRSAASVMFAGSSTPMLRLAFRRMLSTSPLSAELPCPRMPLAFTGSCLPWLAPWSLAAAAAPPSAVTSPILMPAPRREGGVSATCRASSEGGLGAGAGAYSARMPSERPPVRPSAASRPPWNCWMCWMLEVRMLVVEDMMWSRSSTNESARPMPTVDQPCVDWPSALIAREVAMLPASTRLWHVSAPTTRKIVQYGTSRSPFAMAQRGA